MTRQQAQHGTLALIDHGLYAIANFAANLVLARWLPTAEYSVFTIGYAVLLLFGTLHTAMFTEPLLVYGARRFRNHFSQYLMELLRGHAVFTGVLFLLSLLVVAVLSALDSTGSGVILALGLLIPAILLLWLLRRACYAVGRPSSAAVASLVFLVVVLGLLVSLEQFGRLSAISAILAFSVAGLVAVLPLLALLRPSGPRVRSIARFRMLILTRHLRLAKWTSAAGLLTWVSPNVFYFFLPMTHGLEASGSLRAVLNLVIPFQRFFDALQPMLLPLFARRSRDGVLGRSVQVAMWSTLAVGAAMSLLLAIFGDAALHFAYGGEFDAYVAVLYILIPYPIAMGLDTVLGTALVAMERPERTLRAYLYGVAAAILVGGPAAALYGAVGAAVGVLASALVVAVVYGLGYSLHQRQLQMRPTLNPVTGGE